MTNNNPENQFNEESREANVPGGEASNSRLSKAKLKEYGKQGLSPLVEIAQKYQGDIDPYLSAISKALNAAAGSISQDDSNEAEKSIGNLCTEAANWFEDAKGRLGNKNYSDFLSFIEEEGRKHPGILFSASYLAGIFLGRIGRHIGRETISGASESTVH